MTLNNCKTEKNISKSIIGWAIVIHHSSHGSSEGTDTFFSINRIKEEEPSSENIKFETHLIGCKVSVVLLHFVASCIQLRFQIFTIQNISNYTTTSSVMKKK